jgi:hypothetical protein
MTYVHKSGHLPKGEHWAILEFTSVHIPGDERSRTAPGHGYPDRDEDVVNYQSFTDFETFRAKLAEYAKSTYSRDRYVGIHVAGIYRPVTNIELSETR